MHRRSGSLAGLTAAGLLALTVWPSPSRASDRAERELLGVRLWNTYSVVLNKFGPPTRVENGLVSLGDQTGYAGATGGTPGMGGMGMPMTGMGGQPMGMGAAGGSNSYYGMMMMNRMGGGGGPGMGGKMGAMGMAAPGAEGGMSGAPMGMGGPGMMMGGMGMGAGMTQPADTGSEATQTWVYDRGPVHDYFVFNKDGRVVQVESATDQSGVGHGGITARGIKLGDPVSKVYHAYGWAKVDRGGPQPLLDYTRKYHVAFLLDESKGHGPMVVAIAVTLLDDAPLGTLPAQAGALAQNNPAMGAPGAMGMPGMMGGFGRPTAMGMGMGGGISGAPRGAGKMAIMQQMGGGAVGK